MIGQEIKKWDFFNLKKKRFHSLISLISNWYTKYFCFFNFLDFFFISSNWQPYLTPKIDEEIRL